MRHPQSTIRRFERRMWRFVSVYSRGLNGALAFHAEKKYSGHRRIPDFVVETLEQEMKAGASARARMDVDVPPANFPGPDAAGPRLAC